MAILTTQDSICRETAGLFSGEGVGLDDVSSGVALGTELGVGEGKRGWAEGEGTEAEMDGEGEGCPVLSASCDRGEELRIATVTPVISASATAPVTRKIERLDFIVKMGLVRGETETPVIHARGGVFPLT